MEEYKLTKLQNEEMLSLINKRDQINMSLSVMVKFIVDANGDSLPSNSQWRLENNTLFIEDQWQTKHKK